MQKSADAIVIPSIFESYSLVFAESLACGVPVVAFGMPFWKGLYDDAALFVKPMDARALADGIDRVLADAALRKRLASSGKKCAAGHDIRETARAYARLYDELAGR